MIFEITNTQSIIVNCNSYAYGFPLDSLTEREQTAIVDILEANSIEYSFPIKEAVEKFGASMNILSFRLNYDQFISQEINLELAKVSKHIEFSGSSFEATEKDYARLENKLLNYAESKAKSKMLEENKSSFKLMSKEKVVEEGWTAYPPNPALERHQVEYLETMKFVFELI